MARRCACADILSLLDLASVRALPLATRAVLVDVLRQIAASPVPGVLRFLRPVRESVAAWLSITETEAETELAKLVELSFVVVGEDGKSLTSPRIKAAADRSEINRINGLKGGRPPKARVPGQREIMLPIEGGKTEKTETEAASVSPPSSSLKEEALKEEDAHAWVSLGQDLAEVIGLDPAKGFVDCRPVQAWLAMGLEEGQIRAVVAEVAARGKRITGLAYFTPAMRDLANEVRSSAPKAAPAHVAEFDAAWQRWTDGGRVGPAPVLQAAA
jgi:hypothetical protein